jgi:hypothetical protein
LREERNPHRKWLKKREHSMEAIPGVYVFPFWVLVVGAVALWENARPRLNG